MIIKIVTRNTQMGNPRHTYLEFDQFGCPGQSWDIGYHGLDALPEDRREEAARSPEIKVTPTEYKNLIEAGKRYLAMKNGQAS